jgi:hypothetical protein
MPRVNVRSAALLGTLILDSVASSGCAIFLPAHSNSSVRDNESVQIELLDCEAVRDFDGGTLASDWATAFGRDALDCTAPEPRSVRQPVDVMAPIIAPIAAAAVGMAVDFAAAELAREATEYEAQYGAVKAGDRFWRAQADDPKKKTEPVAYADLSQNYYGIRLTRRAGAVGSDGSCDGQPAQGRRACTVLEFVAGIAPSADEQMFQLAPLRFEIRKARAKVLSDELGWWLLPTTWVGKTLRTAGHELDVTAGIVVEAYWKDAQQKLQATKVATAAWDFPSCDLSRPMLQRAACNEDTCEKLENPPSAWLMSIPVSLAPGANTNQVHGRGTFSIAMTITERDRSNAKQYLEAGSKLLTEQKPKIIEQVGQLIGD